jgi:hypothetical protein
MDIFAMLQNATIFDKDGEAVGQAVGFECINGRMRLTAILFDEDMDDGDDDDPDKEDIPEDDASNIHDKIRAISGGKK